MRNFTKILIANRGEIAVRVMRTARAMGYRTVAVFSDADREALHVRQADEAVQIGQAAAALSYLSIENIIGAARRTGADAIHPGYGFLSENAAFAQACESAGITFIGPPVEAIRLMGSKRLSKIAMIAAGVPCVPGYEGADQSDAHFLRIAREIGAPLMVKASAGGGGKGMRLVDDLALLPEALGAARSEAARAFGSAELILERAVIAPRHVEIQVFGDSHGNVIHLGERDCSIQRRHQKVIEETPSPAVDAALRIRMGEAAVRAAAACAYVGAGTVEFLLDAAGNFYFLEMNTRLQVEHPVTEMVTGLDLVEWQIRVGAGEALPLGQEDVRLHGHAIEARLYAEDPRRDFAPQTGLVAEWRLPDLPGLRIDTGVAAGQAISAHYDPMIAKVIAHGPDRATAARRLAAALSDMRLFGLETNRAFLIDLLRHPAFLAGEATTAFIATHFGALAVAEPSSLDWALAACLLAADGGARLPPWRDGDVQKTRLVLASDDVIRTLTVRSDGARLLVEGAGEPCAMRLEHQQPGRARFSLDGHLRVVDFYRDGDRLSLDFGAGARHFTDRTLAPPLRAGAALAGRLVAPMDGAIVAVHYARGDSVQAGDTVVTLEAMKMQTRIVAGITGRIDAIEVKPGEQVKNRQLLVTLTPE